MKRKNGMTIMEVLISVLIISLVVVLLFNLLSQVKNEDTSNQVKSVFVINQSTFIKLIEEDITDYGVKEVSACTASEAGITLSNLSGNDYDDRYRCLKITYAADYTENNIGFITVYNANTKYQAVDGKYEALESKWMIQYQRGHYVINGKSKTWKFETSTMKELPAEIDPSYEPYMIYTVSQATTGNIPNSASIVMPIVTAEGEHYDINLGFNYKSNIALKCLKNSTENSLSNQHLNCYCYGSEDNCNITYTYDELIG